MTNKEKYIDLCKTEKTIPIFSQPFWLDIVAGKKNWDVAIVENKNYEIIGSIPYVWKKKHGFKILTMPKLTPSLGPWLNYPDNQKYHSKLSFEKRVMTQLINQLPKFDYFVQNFHYSITNWLPFYWKGFKQTTIYSYIIESSLTLDQIWKNIDKTEKRDILRAQKILTIKTNLGIKKFFDINKKTFERQGKKIPYSKNFVAQLNSSYKIKNKKMLFAIDKKNRIHGAIYIVWDQSSVYYLMGGGDPKLRNSGAQKLLIWEAIKFASKIKRNFDFEGSIIKKITRSFEGFGAVQKPYFNITKTNSKLLKLEFCLKDILGL